MKKVLLLICLVGMSMSAFAQEEKPEASKPASPQMSALMTASSLAKYGYANSSPTALIEAARIFASIQVQDSNVEKTSENKDAPTVKETKVSFDPAKLLADAREYAGKDKTILALVKSVESELLEGTSRGAVGGPCYTKDRVLAKDYTDYAVKFWANELAEVCLSGDGDTDLDLYVYDSNGNLIGSDTDYTDDCVVRWVPAWTGTFVIRVVNRGMVYNNFVIWTN